MVTEGEWDGVGMDVYAEIYLGECECRGAVIDVYVDDSSSSSGKNELFIPQTLTN